MTAKLDEPLTPADFEALAQFLAQCTDGYTPNLESLDGFFCALIVGPELILPSEYLPLVLGSGTRFNDLEHASRMLPLLMRYWNAIALTLERGGIYDPNLRKRRSHRLMGADWAEAFMRGVDLRHDLWQELIDDKEYGSTILPMIALAQEKDPQLQPLMRPMPKTTRNELLALMTVGLADIYGFFRERRAPPESHTLPLMPRRRSTPKVGRNELCPCGSGKKYKVCCGSGDGSSMH